MGSQVYVPVAVYHAAELEEKASRVVRCVVRGLFPNAQLADSSCFGQSKTSLHGGLEQNKIDAIIGRFLLFLCCWFFCYASV